MFLEDHLDLVAGLRVGLITNPSGVDHLRRSMIDRFAGHPRITLVALFSPEHGIRGSAEAGEYVPFEVDEKQAFRFLASTDSTDRLSWTNGIAWTRSCAHSIPGRRGRSLRRT